MALRSLLLLLPLTLTVLAAGCDDEPDEKGTDRAAPTSGVLAEDASLAWSVELEEDWSPTHAVAVGDTVVVSTSWEIDEGAYVTAYDADGSQAWSESVYGGALLAPVGDDQVLICTDDAATVVSAADGEEVEVGAADDPRCPVADDDAGIPVPHDDEAYTVAGDVVTVDAPDGAYDVTLEAAPSEIWGVAGGLLAFVDETDTIYFYR